MKQKDLLVFAAIAAIALIAGGIIAVPFSIISMNMMTDAATGKPLWVTNIKVDNAGQQQILEPLNMQNSTPAADGTYTSPQRVVRLSFTPGSGYCRYVMQAAGGVLGSAWTLSSPMKWLPFTICDGSNCKSFTGQIGEVQQLYGGTGWVMVELMEYSADQGNCPPGYGTTVFQSQLGGAPYFDKKSGDMTSVFQSDLASCAIRTSTNEVICWLPKSGYGASKIQTRANAEYYNSKVFYPPIGDPQFSGALVCPKFTRGGVQPMAVTIRNNAPNQGTFTLAMDMQNGVFTPVTYSQFLMGAGETQTKTFSIQAGSVDTTSTVTARLCSTGVNDQKCVTATCSAVISGGYNIIPTPTVNDVCGDGICQPPRECNDPLQGCYCPNDCKKPVVQCPGENMAGTPPNCVCLKGTMVYDSEGLPQSCDEGIPWWVIALGIGVLGVGAFLVSKGKRRR